MRITIKSFWPAIVWMVLSTVAFFIPGSRFPANDWLGKLHFDKWVHVGIFTVMIILWCLPLLHRTRQQSLGRLLIILTISFFGYGLMVEVMQHFFVPNRSFDWNDLVADGVGCLIGFFFVRYQWKK